MSEAKVKHTGHRTVLATPVTSDRVTASDFPQTRVQSNSLLKSTLVKAFGYASTKPYVMAELKAILVAGAKLAAVADAKLSPKQETKIPEKVKNNG